MLEAAGLRVGVVTEPACCGLTWVSTGQLTAARRIIGHTIDVLHPYVERGSPVLGLEPDLVSVGKALGSGVPVGAILMSERVAQAISPGDHGTTYGGNLLACRAALFFLEQLMDHGLLDHVNSVGPRFERRLRALALKHPVIVETRGVGLMHGLQLAIDAGPIVDTARQHGLLVNRTNEKVVRMLPPLTIEAADIDKAVDILDEVFATVQTEVSA